MRRLIAPAIAFLFAFSALAAQDVIKKGFNVAAGGTLHLDHANGDIKVVTGGSGVAVEITRKSRGRDAEKRLADHKITFSQNGNDVTITSDDDRDHGFRWFDWDDYEVQWNIRVPAHYNVDVSTSGGSIDLADIGGTTIARTSGGDIETGRLGGESTLKTSGGGIKVAGGSGKLIAHTSGGSIDIGDVSGAVEAKTSGGDITLARIEGDVLARSSGGGITIDNAMGSVDATTSGGSIRARMSRQPNGDSKLSTSGGGVTLSLAPSISVDLDARASGGGVTSDVPVTVQGTQEDDSLQGRVNGGGPKLVLRTSGGGIKVKSM
jgi:DUF4097 and DUF4098 domain-containing protein YvlB